MSELQIFEVLGSGMRFGTTEKGRPYVVAADFAPKLGYSRASDALRMVDDEEKGTQIVRTPGGDQNMAVLYEDGIWELIFLSRRHEAKALKGRVKEILRQLRETGRYSAQPEQPLSRKELARNWYEAEIRAEEAEQRVAELEPQAESWAKMVSAEGDYSIGDAAKMLQRAGVDTGPQRLFWKLQELGWIFRRAGAWHAYQRHVDNGRLTQRATFYYHPKSGERVTGDAQVRLTAKGMHDLRKALGASSALIPIEGGAS